MLNLNLKRLSNDTDEGKRKLLLRKFHMAIHMWKTYWDATFSHEIFIPHMKWERCHIRNTYFICEMNPGSKFHMWNFGVRTKHVFTYVIEDSRMDINCKKKFSFHIWNWNLQFNCEILRWYLHGSELALLAGLALLAEISSPCEILCKICFRLHVRRASPPRRVLAINYPEISWSRAGNFYADTPLIFACEIARIIFKGLFYSRTVRLD